MLLFALGLMTLVTAAAKIPVRGICHLHVYLKNSNDEKIRSFVILTFAISSTTRRLIT